MKHVLTAALLSFTALPASAEMLTLEELSEYFNDLGEATGGFTQINADGTIATGEVFMRRPGRLRFEYDPPEETLVVVGGGQVAIFDPRSNDGAERFPLRETPLKILLEADVDLTRTDMVTGHTFDGTSTKITAQDPDNPDRGYIQLVFTADPIELRQWIVSDNTGGQTTVILQGFGSGGDIPFAAFNIQAELAARGLDD